MHWNAAFDGNTAEGFRYTPDIRDDNAAKVWSILYIVVSGLTSSEASCGKHPIVIAADFKRFLDVIIFNYFVLLLSDTSVSSVH